MKNLKPIKKYVLSVSTGILLIACGSLKIEPNDCIGSCIDGTTAFEKSKHRIELSRAKQLYYNYNDSIKPAIKKVQEKLVKRHTISDKDGYKPTEYVLINIETLKCYLKFLEEVEKKNRDAGKTNSEITGIAVFLGANGPNETLWNKEASFNDKMLKERSQIKQRNAKVDPKLPVPMDEDIRWRLTTFLAPTFYDNEKDSKLSESQKHVPFFIEAPDSSKPYVGKYMSLLNKFEKMKNDDESGIQMMVIKTGTDTSLNYDEFTQMPPKKTIQ